MAVSFVVQLSTAALGEGRLAGRVEVVLTGHRSAFATASDLVAFLLQCGAEQLQSFPSTPGGVIPRSEETEIHP